MIKKFLILLIALTICLPVFAESIDITDESGKTWTAKGTAHIDQDQAKFGNGSLHLDGNSDWVDTPNHADWDLGTGEFASEFQVWFNVKNVDQVGLMYMGVGTTSFEIFWRGQVSGSERIRLKLVNTWYTFNWSPNENQWYHVAITREGSNVRCFIDGTQIGATETNSGSVAVNDPLSFGAYFGGALYLNGRMDEIRVSNVVRYSSNFTAPTAEFSDDANTLVLLHLNEPVITSQQIMFISR